MKKLTAFLCMLICILSLTACAQTDTEATSSSNYDVATLQDNVENLITSLEDTADSDIESIINMNNKLIADDDETALSIKNSYQSWLDSKEELGAFTPQDSDVCTVTEDDDGVTVTLETVFEKRDATVTVSYDVTGQMVSFAFSPVYSLTENLESAALNTVLDMGIVFIVLIFIAFIISLFKFIYKAQNRTAGAEKEKESLSQKPERPAPAPVAAPTPAPAPVSSEEVDDLELVAVITAAVVASMNTSVDSLVVRSIKKRSTNKWQKA